MKKAWPTNGIFHITADKFVDASNAEFYIANSRTGRYGNLNISYGNASSPLDPVGLEKEIGASKGDISEDRKNFAGNIIKIKGGILQTDTFDVVPR